MSRAETAIGDAGWSSHPAVPLSRDPAVTRVMSKPDPQPQEPTGASTTDTTDHPTPTHNRAGVSDHAAAAWDARTDADSASPERACERAIRLDGYHAIEYEWPRLSVRFDPATGTVLLLGDDGPAWGGPTLVTVLKHEQLYQNQAAYVGAGVRDRVAQALAEWQGDDPDLVRESAGRVELGGGR